MSGRKNIDMQTLDTAGEYELNQLKKWLFNENIRLVAREKEIEDEHELLQAQQQILKKQQHKNNIYKTQLDNQKILFEQQWALMEAEIRRLAIEKEQFENQKSVYKDQIYREARRGFAIDDSGRLFFKGVKDGQSLKKRYKELAKIYHPDNPNGDSDTLLSIKKEYEKLCKIYFDM